MKVELEAKDKELTGQLDQTKPKSSKYTHAAQSCIVVNCIQVHTYSIHIAGVLATPLL